MRTGTLASQGAVTSPSLNGQGSPNILRNGDFEVAQRGATFAAVANGAYTLDGFGYSKGSDAVITITQDTDVPTFAQAGHLSRHSLKIQVTTADATIAAGQYEILYQKVEGYDIYPTVGKSLTLSFWVKAKKTGVYCAGFQSSNGDRSMIKEYTVLAADTWEKKTVTIAMDYSGGTWNYTNGIGLICLFTLACGSTYQTTKDAWQSSNVFATSSQVNAMDSTDNYLSISQAKLEVGATATQFVPVPYQQELARAQRYCVKFTGAPYTKLAVGQVYSANTSGTCVLRLPFIFRDGTATFTVFGSWLWSSQLHSGAATNFSATNPVGSGMTSIEFSLSATATLGEFIMVYANNDATAYVMVTNEL